ncbi:MAG: hypothetical protein WD802_08890 [Gemmatimonadaceae bacterium]
MNAVFTIAAKNYLAQARTLGDSIKRIHPALPFHVILLDEVEGALDLAREPYPTIEATQLGITAHRDMAFKYDLVEFATAIKPFVFRYLFDRYDYEKLIYFDPDIFVYSTLDLILEALDEHFLILTPHVTKLELSNRGVISEETLLFVGAYNLGFVAFNRSERSQSLIEWWKTRLENKGYADRFDALHVDQKWMDLIPGFFDSGVWIARHPGLNASHWNMHERVLGHEAGAYTMDGSPLVFFHFSGFDPKTPHLITGPQKQSLATLQDKPEYAKLFRTYAEDIQRNRTASADLPYSYAQFANGVRIFAFQRRLYRKLSEAGYRYEDPFATVPGSFYDTLRENKLLIADRDAAGEYRQTSISRAGLKLRLLKRALLLLKKIIGIKYYHLWLRTMAVLSRPEEQTFLLETLRLDQPVRFGMIPGTRSD